MDLEDESGRTALFLAIVVEGHGDVADILRDNGATKNIIKNMRRDALD